MESYYEATHDVDFVKKHVSTLEKEYNFWQHRRTVQFNHTESRNSYVLARYRADSDTPRPEGYSHDLHDAKHIPKGKFLSPPLHCKHAFNLLALCMLLIFIFAVFCAISGFCARMNFYVVLLLCWFLV